MTRPGQPRRNWDVGVGIVALCLVTLAVAGCGNDGSADATLPRETPSIQPEITGVVLMPNGQLASTHHLWDWGATVSLVAPAYAITYQNPNVFAVEDGVRVALSRVDGLDAADGIIKTPLLLTESDTDETGRYSIIDSRAQDVDQCRLMVAVGGPDQLTRAFVFSHNTNIDVTSEAVVRMVLDRLTKAPPVQLCQNFTNSGLQVITDAVSKAVFSANADTVSVMNEVAFEKARVNKGVRDAIDAVTGVPVRN